MKVDFEKLKRDVSLPEFFLYLGWKFVSGSSNSSPKMTNGSSTIVIKKNSKDYFTYWDVHGEARGKTIIDLMQQHIYDQTGRMPSLREAGEAVQNYVNNKEVVLSQDSRFGVSNAKLDPSQLAFLNNQLKPYQGDFLQKRGITQDTLSSPVFSGVFTSREYRKDGKVYNNTCTKLINQNGFQGISQRGIRPEDGKSFKGISGNKYDSIVVSKHDKTRPIEHIYISESMIDAASHYQMKLPNTEKNILYISTEGNITQGQMDVIKLLLSKHINNINDQVTYIFDNDSNGYKYALKLDTFLKGQELPNIEGMPVEELKEKVLQLPNVDLSVNSDWNDDLQASISKGKEYEFLDAIKKNDFTRIAGLKDEGYFPSSEMINNLKRSAPVPTVIAVQKIFSLPSDAPGLSNIKLAQSDSKGILNIEKGI
ncbi:MULTISPECIES: toprim domain-containing protein [Bacteroidaceae]|mgnify:CR=1 FL=1|uniref:toprim domain-containing protein n=1 Tax=Bacteroidaceae TaxID=815 RepID=UPI0020301795|nr:toprim domain-containing protein [Phocaeicola vulgatus]MCM1612121.1 toprim domain-containing protein [Phocaeicola vulgatus]MCM1676476.1 toprim domain-containing protein [Phocaeicola vulgatus]MCM1680625.1 toprim domain-containing protein [Phocaeicola vulgatus]MCM1804138.1 toprim domain-containing protein [Phocaeicola vulgatus]MCM1838039.1 toprim domain-containing protein [Phocaeicola vulgatus]